MLVIIIFLLLVILGGIIGFYADELDSLAGAIYGVLIALMLCMVSNILLQEKLAKGDKYVTVVKRVEKNIYQLTVGLEWVPRGSLDERTAAYSFYVKDENGQPTRNVYAVKDVNLLEVKDCTQATLKYDIMEIDYPNWLLFSSSKQFIRGVNIEVPVGNILTSNN